MVPVIVGKLLLPVLVISMADESSRILFDFASREAAKDWQTVNDDVMGGVSRSRFEITENKTLLFTGTLSLENNGGFASVRSRAKPLGLQPGDLLLVRVRGDGRNYSLNLYSAQRTLAFSYRANLPTRKAEWLEVELPLTAFRATSFGWTIPNAAVVKPEEITAVGVMISDKQAGPFHLEIAEIRVKRRPQ